MHWKKFHGWFPLLYALVRYYICDANFYFSVYSNLTYRIQILYSFQTHIGILQIWVIFFAPFEGHPLDSAFGILSVSDKLFIYIYIYSINSIFQRLGFASYLLTHLSKQVQTHIHLIRDDSLIWEEIKYTQS